jgi:uncharacterized membrane protein YkvA (DUF1232 family)
MPRLSAAFVSARGIVPSTGMLDRMNEWARLARRDVYALYLAGRDPRVPWYAKALAVAVAAYALSPIDLIPDFIPVLGYLDDVIIVPLGILAAIRLIPAEILAEHRTTAEAKLDRPVSRTAGAVIVGIWIVLIGLSAWVAYRCLA